MLPVTKMGHFCGERVCVQTAVDLRLRCEPTQHNAPTPPRIVCRASCLVDDAQLLSGNPGGSNLATLVAGGETCLPGLGEVCSATAQHPPYPVEPVIGASAVSVGVLGCADARRRLRPIPAVRQPTSTTMTTISRATSHHGSRLGRSWSVRSSRSLSSGHC